MSDSTKSEHCDNQRPRTAKNWPKWAISLVVPPSRHAAWVTKKAITCIGKIGEFFTFLFDVLCSAHMRGCWNRGWKEEMLELPGVMRVGPFVGRSSGTCSKHEG